MTMINTSKSGNPTTIIIWIRNGSTIVTNPAISVSRVIFLPL